jgi:hypothetical protein
MPNEKDLNRLSSHELGTLSDEKEKELQTAINHQATLEQEILLLRRQVIDLQGKIKDLEFARSKATQNRQVISSELRIYKSKFFAAKNGGL